jgi:hypothetical protein
MNDCALARFIPRTFTPPKTIDANHLADSALPGTPRITLGLFIGLYARDLDAEELSRLRVSLRLCISAFISFFVPIKKSTLHPELVPCSP